MMRKGIVTTCSALLLGALPSSARAAEPAADGGTEGKASAGVSLGTKDGPKADAETEADASAQGDAKRGTDRGDVPWLKRWAPERNMAELGLYGGVLFPARRLELFEPDLTQLDQGFQEFKRVAPSVGLRLGYYPLRVFGAEGEVGVMPTRTAGDERATLWGMRLHFVGQLPLWSVTPFVLLGGGMLNVASGRDAVGNDVDAAIHFGGGVKVFINRYAMVRLDIRDHVTAGQGVDDGVIHSPEVLLGASFTLGRKKGKPAAPGDRDGDGILDPDDQCVDVPGVPEYQGCPIPDTDGDGILDPDDQCVDVPGVPEYQGCPIPDTDGDGILDPDDECVDVPGVPEYEGCPIPDTDGDGILDPDDQCIDDPETKNGYQDKDGCPDEIPKDLGKFTGVIEGIYFDVNKDVIKKKSTPKLKRALDIFKKYSDVQMEISGHTDSTGSREHNLDLSRRRAESVKRWLVERGVDESRISTRGAGPDEPVATNDNKKGRAKNRRIEFKLK